MVNFVFTAEDQGRSRVRWESAVTYSDLNNDVSDCSITKGRPWSWATSVADLLEDDTLVEVDAVVSNITGKGHMSVHASPETPGLHLQEKPRR